MSKSIFQSPKKALMMVGATMFGVVILVGSEDREGALVQAAATVESATVEDSASQAPATQRFNANPGSIRRVQQPAQTYEADGWAEDSDLIDDTSGFDPTPESFDPADGDLYLVEDEY